jgi:hypothetical protein
MRIVVSSQHLQQGKVEFHDRRTDETWLVALDNVENVLNVWR